MKLMMKLLALSFGALMLANAANAESPREQLEQMVGQLQKSPDDNALREKIIKLANKLKPALAIPEEAERRMVRGTAAFKGAKSVADYQSAAYEFEQATLAAPWYGDAYFNLGVAQEKAENYEAALRSLKLAQLASPEVKEIKALIYEVEYRNERASSPEAQAAKRKQQVQSFEGLWRVVEMRSGQATWQIPRTDLGFVYRISKIGAASYEVANLARKWERFTEIRADAQSLEWFLLGKGCDDSSAHCGDKYSCRLGAAEDMICLAETVGYSFAPMEVRLARRERCESLGYEDHGTMAMRCQ